MRFVIFKKMLLTVIIICGVIYSAQGQIILPGVISDNMVLQQNQEVKIWGWTTHTNEELKIWGSWNNDTISVKANMGHWITKLKTPSYGGPYILNIQGHEHVQIHNVLIGEVWLASGQSNMQMPVDSTGSDFRGVINYRKEIKAANYPNIRYFDVSRKIAETPQDDLIGSWEQCSPSTVRDFSAVAYFFAKKLHKSLDCPIGIIESSWGATNAETWTRKKLIENDSLLNNNKIIREGGGRPTKPGLAYNAMIHPLRNYHIKGIIWYQGESNISNYQIYKRLMSVLITSWREAWGLDFPFYFTQIAPFKYANSSYPPYLREAQLESLSIPNTGMAITNDAGDKNHIHPRNKRPIGERLARIALSQDYNIRTDNLTGPLFKKAIFKNGKAYINFTNAHGGLKIKGEFLKDIKISGENKTFYPAKTEIDGNTLIVYSKDVDKPIAVRVGFDNMGVINLYNKEDIPASPFRTDNWPPEI